MVGYKTKWVELKNRHYCDSAIAAVYTAEIQLKIGFVEDMKTT